MMNQGSGKTRSTSLPFSRSVVHRALVFLSVGFLMPGSASSQDKPALTIKQRAIVMERIDSLMMNYMSKSTLTLPGYIKQNDKVAKEYKRLFLPDARVFDDIAADYVNRADLPYPYVLKTRDLDDWHYKLIDMFPSGLVIRNKRLAINYNNLESGTVSAALHRSISGTTDTGFDFSNDDTLRLTIAVLPDLTVKIKEVAPVGSSAAFRVNNDDDLDGVINSVDECKDAKGKRELAGCPDRDNDGIPDRKDECPDIAGTLENKGCHDLTFSYRFMFSGAVGYQFNRNRIFMPQASALGAYARFDDDNSRIDDAETLENPNFKGGVTLAANITYYFGKKAFNKKKGISLGIWAANYNADYQITDARFVYKANDGVHDYRRYVTINSASENLKFNFINFPILLKYRVKLNKKWGIELAGGPSITTLITRSEYTVNADFEGVYQYLGNGEFGYLPTFNEGNVPTQDLLLFDKDIQNQLYGVNTPAAFLLLSTADANYDFKLDEQYSGTTKVKPRTGIAINAGIDLSYNLTSKILWKMGFTATYCLLGNATGDADFKMLDKVSDSYRSVYDSNARSRYAAFGINTGFILGL